MGDITKDFSKSEFKCPCCGKNLIKKEIIDALQALRDLLGYPIIVTSGYRCIKHNARVGGVPNSEHTKGIAADIVVKELTPKEVATAAEMIPAFKNGGIGVYKTWVHLDIRGKSARWYRT